MSLTPDEKRRIRGIWIHACYATALLAPLGWIFFLLLTRNSFRLDRFATEDFYLVLGAALIPMVFNLLACFAGRGRHQPRWSWLFPVILFLVAALGWSVTLGNCFGQWTAALKGEAISREQYHRLLLSTAAGISGALIPLIFLLLPGRKAPRKDP